MYLFKPIEIHSIWFRYLYTHQLMAVLSAILQVHSTIGQYPVYLTDAILCYTDVLSIFPTYGTENKG